MLNVPLLYEYFHDIEVLGEHLTSEKCKGSTSSCISAFGAGIAGRLCTNTKQMRIGVVNYFFIHDISLSSSTDAGKRCKASYIFAKICWFRTHPHETLLPSPLDFDALGPSTFMPLSRIQSRCAVAYDKVQFTYGIELLYHL